MPPLQAVAPKTIRLLAVESSHHPATQRLPQSLTLHAWADERDPVSQRRRSETTNRYDTSTVLHRNALPLEGISNGFPSCESRSENVFTFGDVVAWRRGAEEFATALRQRRAMRVHTPKGGGRIFVSEQRRGRKITHEAQTASARALVARGASRSSDTRGDT